MLPGCQYEELIDKDQQTLTFTLERETKNTYRYSEDADGKPPAIGTLYPQKWLLGKEPPNRLTVTIEESEGGATHFRGVWPAKLERIRHG
jgi:hypothetical protein